MRRLVPGLLLGVTLAACSGPDLVVEGGSDPAAGTQPAAWTYHEQVENVLPGAVAAVAVTDAESLASSWQELGFAGSIPEVNFDDHVVLLLGQADDACPDELIALEVVDGALEVEWLPPPGGCNQPLIMRVHAVEVHRGHLAEEFTYGLQEPFESELEPVTISLPPYDGEAPAPPTPPAAMSDDDLDAVFAGHAVQRCGPEHRFPPPAEVDGPLSSDPEVARAQEQRAQFGVASDEATVRSLLENPPDHGGVEDFGFPLTPEEMRQDQEASQTIEGVVAWLQRQGYGEREVVPMIDRSDGVRAAVVAGEQDADGLQQSLDAEFGEGTVHVHLSPWNPGDVAGAQDAVTRGMDRIGEHAQVTWISGPPGPAEIGLIDPTREALDVIADLVDPNLVCVSVELTGIRPLPGG